MRRLTLSKKLHSSVSRGRPWQTDNPYTCSLEKWFFPDAHVVGENTSEPDSHLADVNSARLYNLNRPALAGGCALSSSSDMQGRPHQEDDEQVGRVEGVEEPLRNLGLHVGGQEDQRRGQEGKDLKADACPPTTRAIGSSRDPPQRAGR